MYYKYFLIYIKTLIRVIIAKHEVELLESYSVTIRCALTNCNFVSIKYLQK